MEDGGRYEWWVIVFKVVYVIIDDEKLKYVAQLVLSLLSLQHWMPELPVEIVTDAATYHEITTGKLKQYFKDGVAFKVVPIPEIYDKKQKSRFLKTSLREIVEGDYLFLDTDTVVCRPFPVPVAKAELALALDLNAYPQEHFRLDGMDYCYAQSGIQKPALDCFYNSGVMLVKDTEYTHQVYALWHSQWRMLVEKGFACLDQPPLHKVVQEHKLAIAILEDVWNCQLACNPFPVELLDSAYIVHYFNDEDSLLDLPQFGTEDYEAKLREFIRAPKAHLKKIYAVDYERDKAYYRSSIYHVSHLLYERTPGLFKCLDKVAAAMYGIFHGVKSLVKKG